MIKKLSTVLVIILIVIASFTIYKGWTKYESAIKQTPLEDMVKSIQEKENYTKLDDVSKTFTKAISCVEDRRFYYHKGVDVIGIMRATITNVRRKSISEGGSTITQQLAKNMYFIGEDSLVRKIAEMFMAIEIEKNYNKEEILELYINVIYYGSGYYNIYDASMGYFNKSPDKLSDYEATLLAGVPNAPSKYSPKVNVTLAHKRQEKVLDVMVQNKYITKEEKAVILENQ